MLLPALWQLVEEVVRLEKVVLRRVYCLLCRDLLLLGHTHIGLGLADVLVGGAHRGGELTLRLLGGALALRLGGPHLLLRRLDPLLREEDRVGRLGRVLVELVDLNDLGRQQLDRLLEGLVQIVVLLRALEGLVGELTLARAPPSRIVRRLIVVRDHGGRPPQVITRRAALALLGLVHALARPADACELDGDPHPLPQVLCLPLGRGRAARLLLLPRLHRRRRRARRPLYRFVGGEAHAPAQVGLVPSHRLHGAVRAEGASHLPRECAWARERWETRWKVG